MELIHLSEAHRDIFRGGFTLGASASGKKGDSGKDGKERLTLKWSTPKTSTLDLQRCTSAYRVTPTNVTSRPTICLVNFVLSGKPVLLEQPRKGSLKLISHVLMNHAGSIYLHCIPSTRSHVEDPPSISEGWGGRITDYRISDFCQLVTDNMLCPIAEDRTKIPHVLPLQRAMSKLERESRHWPLVYTDTLVYTLAQELQPLPVVVRKEKMSEQDLEECKKVIKALQNKENSNESLSVPNIGARSKGVKRDEQYRCLWAELESLTQTFSSNSELHRKLANCVSLATTHAPSMQLARKTPQEGGLQRTVQTDSMWSSVDTEQYMKIADPEMGDIAGGMWERERGNVDPRTHRHEHGNAVGSGLTRHLPRPAPPIGSVASIWAARQANKDNAGHTEFAGRMTFGPKAELYLKMRANSSIVPPEQDT